MSVWVGTSGYNYPEWKGSFYPATLPAAKMLPYYAERFPTVEINYTFYRMPTGKIVEGWSAATPSRFALTMKAPRRITHDSRRVKAGDLFVCIPRALRRVSRRAPAQGSRGLRVPSRLVVRRGGVRASARKESGAVRR